MVDNSGTGISNPDDEIVEYETAIVDGIGPNVGLQRVAVTRRDKRERIARDVVWQARMFLAYGGTADELRALGEAAIASGSAGPTIAEFLPKFRA